MKKGSLVLVVMALGVWGSALRPIEARAVDYNGRWGIQLQGGVAALTQDVATDLTAGKDPVISARLFYGVGDSALSAPLNGLADFFFLSATERAYPLLLGVNLEWEEHRIKDKVTGLSYGKIHTLSLIPYAELHATGYESFSPYVLLGLGLHFNGFNESTELTAQCTSSGVTCSISPKKTVAVEFGGGADYFVSPRLALNMEINWKYNSHGVDTENIARADLQRFKTSHASFLLGLRYIF